MANKTLLTLAALAPIGIWLLAERQNGKGTNGDNGNGGDGDGNGNTLVGYPPIGDPPADGYETYGQPMPFITTLPDVRGGTAQQRAQELATRNAMILSEVKQRLANGQLDVPMSVVVVKGDTHTATIPVMADALKLDGVRVNVDFLTAQAIADAMGLYLLTSKVADEINDQTWLKVPPSNQSWNYQDKTGIQTQRMIDHSVIVDRKIQAAQALGQSIDIGAGGKPVAKAWPVGGWNADITNNPGKLWINTARNWEPNTPAKGANYGWHQSSGGMLQGPNPGMAHYLTHTDYSQVFRAMGPSIFLTPNDNPDAPAVEISMVDALTNPQWAGFVSREGSLKLARHPAIPPMIA